jgi:hypothetical protein
MVSLGDAAATAALIVAKQPPVPPGFTHRVAANRRFPVPRMHPNITAAAKTGLEKRCSILCIFVSPFQVSKVMMRPRRDGVTVDIKRGELEAKSQPNASEIKKE